MEKRRQDGYIQRKKEGEKEDGGVKIEERDRKKENRKLDIEK